MTRVLAPLALALTLAGPASGAPAFDRYLLADIPVANGFDYPVGDPDAKGRYTDPTTGATYDGWYVAATFCENYALGLHPGEDWNGVGGGDTDLGQPVFTVAAGQVVYAREAGAPWGRVVVVEHLYYENLVKKRIRSLYAHLGRIDVEEGQDVSRRQQLGVIGKDPDGLYHAHLHLELRTDLDLATTFWPSSEGKDEAWVRQRYLPPTEFIRGHRQLFVPQAEPLLLLIEESTRRMLLYEHGALITSYEVGFGQSPGHKREQGDNRTPKGMYFVTRKALIQSTDGVDAYYGGHWIKINYPNPWDAAHGVDQGWITPLQADEITEQWQRRKLTAQDTRLGGGIGLHGWAHEWDGATDGYLLSWGCIVMHLRDVAEVYERVDVGAMVVIF